MDKIVFTPIGIIHSSFKNPKGTPIQPTGAKESHGIIEVFNEYTEGLTDLDGFSHIFLLYHFHLAKKQSLMVKPFMDDIEHGIFAIRGPSRPNPIGLSIVKLESLENNILKVSGLDILDGTPLLDIKPFVPAFDNYDDVRIGWLKTNVKKATTYKDDGRFSE
ncbi:MAG TPA: tRNA (N6-threonylcarbamoyladenosine(37)-N6)-methyltransferase TrmO [Bacteroidales bacterium]|nr:tRNA (N6-threonylcarbamoyladenosine(37)-N6)-methyltransferase TrmO [Bacteroidales bacterium]MDD4235114.1 tRNA (N6-threonylcarbamoyladenosine(37)-N6)-methyltransferase TrmO [Bacteroidales bacterium]HRW20725.1 tRNA (N6-threonylcarbamoyladenosine(37)-N6)-methyltransferase TrmO [Bacteroidales bacterium]